MLKLINLDRCRKAVKNIYIHGLADSGVRREAVEDAIAAIQTDGSTALLYNYMGVKNYASFGDQREDHKYGGGPRNGHIVFSIGRVTSSRVLTLGADEVYLLECVRDAKPIEMSSLDRKRPSQGYKVNISEALLLYDDLAEECNYIGAQLAVAQVDSHEEKSDASSGNRVAGPAADKKA